MYTYDDCILYLNYLDNIGYETMWIRYLWKLNGMTNQWCIQKCKEIIERYNVDDPLIDPNDTLYSY